MIEYLKLLRVLYGDRRGVTALEYALIAGVVAAVVVTGFTTLGLDINTMLAALSAKIGTG